MKLQGKVSIVSGAGRGIGAAIAVSFAREGSELVLISRTMHELEQVAQQVRKYGRRAVVIEADVSLTEQVENIFEVTTQEFGRIDVLVNNAGIQGPIGPLIDNDITEWFESVRINLFGNFLLTRMAIRSMKEQRSGKIINISGGGATSSRPYFSSYAVSKAAIVRLTEVISDEVKEYNIQVNAIAPGSVNTRMLHEIIKAGDAAGKEAAVSARKQLKTGGVPPEKAAALAVFLASSDSDGITGRLLSAVWDKWPETPKHLSEIAASDVYMLRRIVPKDRGFNWG